VFRKYSKNDLNKKCSKTFLHFLCTHNINANSTNREIKKFIRYTPPHPTPPHLPSKLKQKPKKREVCGEFRNEIKSKLNINSNIYLPSNVSIFTITITIYIFTLFLSINEIISRDLLLILFFFSFSRNNTKITY